MSVTVVDELEQPEQPKRNYRKWAIAGGLALVFVGAAGLTVYATRKRRKKELQLMRFGTDETEKKETWGEYFSRSGTIGQWWFKTTSLFGSMTSSLKRWTSSNAAPMVTSKGTTEPYLVSEDNEAF
jgi:hypothetical protein